MKKTLLQLSLLLTLAVTTSFAIDNLKLNSQLNYSSDSRDGPLITGDDAQAGFVAGKTNYVIIYGEGCFNSKRQALRTVELYNKYRNQVHFVVVGLRTLACLALPMVGPDTRRPASAHISEVEQH